MPRCCRARKAPSLDGAFSRPCERSSSCTTSCESRVPGSRPGGSRGRMRTLVLNAGYEPLAIVSFKRALVLVMNDKATVIERVEDDPVWGTHGVYDRPAVIILSRYVRVPTSRRVP
ncbi:unnamed protein product, partial [Penicillium discolor]